MFGKKKFPVLTEMYCIWFQNLLMGISVMLGKEVRIKDLDFNTRRGHVYIDDIARLFCFIGDSDNFDFSLLNELSPLEREWFAIRFSDSGEAMVFNEKLDNDHKRADGMPLYWMGKSANDRKEVPLYPSQA